ncbi:MAG: hypothetical protein CR982_03040 [Candidatus Cloacimonadota bacterium]|nr:MAG: hypothetical protein CR982_03040 [Candidatus Cloacimonadota bacterium]PIE82040.1 MAG: hypothetical protein CSA15_00230 [Candidatus Delongbacteria bacterium]
MSEEFLSSLKSSSSIDEIATIILENWKSVEPDNLSGSEIIEFRKFLLNKNFISLSKKLTPTDSFSYNRFNFSRAVLGELDKKKLIYNKLKFAIWHKLVTRKVISFLAKVENEETKSKLSLLIESLKSLEDVSSPINRREIAEKFMILSDLTGQLGYHMFSIISIKRSVTSDPEFIDATLFLGKAYIEMGSALNRRDRSGKSSEYNINQSKYIFESSLEKLPPEKREKVSDLLDSIKTLMGEIKKQKIVGKNTIAQVVVEDFISDKLTKLEDFVIGGYKNNRFAFPSNVMEYKSYKVVNETTKEQAESISLGDNEGGVETPLSVSKSMDQFRENALKKPGKLFDLYNNNERIKENSHKVKSGKVKSDSLGYKIEPRERLKKLIEEKSELLKKK